MSQLIPYTIIDQEILNNHLIKEIYLSTLGINKGVSYFYILISYGTFPLITCIKNFAVVYVTALMRRRLQLLSPTTQYTNCKYL